MNGDSGMCLNGISNNVHAFKAIRILHIPDETYSGVSLIRYTNAHSTKSMFVLWDLKKQQQFGMVLRIFVFVCVYVSNFVCMYAVVAGDF